MGITGNSYGMYGISVSYNNAAGYSNNASLWAYIATGTSTANVPTSTANGDLGILLGSASSWSNMAGGTVRSNTNGVLLMDTPAETTSGLSATATTAGLGWAWGINLLRPNPMPSLGLNTVSRSSNRVVRSVSHR